MNRTRKAFLVIMACVVMLFATACGKNDSSSFKHGSWSGSTYTSEFLGIKIPAGSDWTITSDTELAQAFGVSDMSDSSIKSIFDKGGVLTEMMAGNDDGTSINITVQDNTGIEGFSEAQYLDSAMELVESQFEAFGLSCTAQKKSVDFLGKSTDCIELAVEVSDQTIYELQIPIFKSHYTASITFASFNKSELNTLVSSVTAA